MRLNRVATSNPVRATLLCWRCQEPLDEAEAVTVRTNPDLPEWMSRSVTKVHPKCALDGPQE